MEIPLIILTYRVSASKMGESVKNLSYKKDLQFRIIVSNQSFFFFFFLARSISYLILYSLYMPLQGVEILNLKKKSQSCFWCTALFISSLHKYNFLNPKVFHSLHFKHQNKDILKIIFIFRPFVMVLTHFFLLESPF